MLSGKTMRVMPLHSMKSLPPLMPASQAATDTSRERVHIQYAARAGRSQPCGGAKSLKSSATRGRLHQP